MEWTSVAVFILVIFALLYVFFRLKGHARHPSNIQAAMALVSALDDNFKMIKRKRDNAQDKKQFKVTVWLAYEQFLDFLEPETVSALKDAFTMMIDYNKKIGSAPIESGPPVPEISYDSLWDVMLKGRMGLAAWVKENLNRETVRGFFSWR